jgi:nucleoredoxin
LELLAGSSPAAQDDVNLRLLAILTVSALSIFIASARQLPLTLKEIGLMLRSGFSNDAIIQDLAKRHFAEKLDGPAEMTLLKAGASPALLFAIKSGSYSLSPEEAAKAKQEVEAEAKRRAVLAEESRRFNTLYQDKLAQERADELLKFHATNSTYDYLKGALVRPGNNGFVRTDDDAIGKKKLIAYYFSAHWCPPCRKFTPQLVQYYNRVAAEHPEFEVVFYSFDKSAAEMEQYMRESNMPWPAIDYDKRNEKKELLARAGNGIPALVLVDASGRLISSSFDGKRNIAPQKVLDDLDSVLAGKQINNVAANH